MLFSPQKKLIRAKPPPSGKRFVVCHAVEVTFPAVVCHGRFLLLKPTVRPSGKGGGLPRFVVYHVVEVTFPAVVYHSRFLLLKPTPCGIPYVVYHGAVVYHRAVVYHGVSAMWESRRGESAQLLHGSLLKISLRPLCRTICELRQIEQ